MQLLLPGVLTLLALAYAWSRWLHERAPSRLTELTPWLALGIAAASFLITVAGLVIAFGAIADTPAESKQTVLAAGISVAMRWGVAGGYAGAGALWLALGVATWRWRSSNKKS